MVNAEIPEINLKLKKAIYEKLLTISTCFKIEASESLGSQASSLEDKRRSTMEEIITEKTQLMKNAKKIEQVYTRSKGINQWNKKLCILSGSYLYFFENAMAQKYESVFYLKNSKI